MKFAFLILLIGFFTNAIKAQDDSDRTIVNVKSKDSDVEITYHDKNKRFATVRTYDKSGVLQTEENYSDFPLKQKKGHTKCFYPTGEVYWVCDYNNNKLHGEFRVYYPSGSTKRIEKYKNGNRKSGHCFDESENEVLFTPFYQQATFIGGQYALQAHIRKYVKSVKVGSIPEFANASLIIKADSTVDFVYVSNLQISKDILKEIVATMPKWIPTMYDGVALESVYPLNLVFSHGSVYLSNLLPGFSSDKNRFGNSNNNQIPTEGPKLPERRKRF